MKNLYIKNLDTLKVEEYQYNNPTGSNYNCNYDVLKDGVPIAIYRHTACYADLFTRMSSTYEDAEKPRTKLKEFGYTLRTYALQEDVDLPEEVVYWYMNEIKKVVPSFKFYHIDDYCLEYLKAKSKSGINFEEIKSVKTFKKQRVYILELDFKKFNSGATAKFVTYLFRHLYEGGFNRVIKLLYNLKQVPANKAISIFTVFPLFEYTFCYFKKDFPFDEDNWFKENKHTSGGHTVFQHIRNGSYITLKSIKLAVKNCESNPRARWEDSLDNLIKSAATIEGKQLLTFTKKVRGYETDLNSVEIIKQVFGDFNSKTSLKPLINILTGKTKFEYKEK